MSCPSTRDGDAYGVPERPIDPEPDPDQDAEDEAGDMDEAGDIR